MGPVPGRLHNGANARERDKSRPTSSLLTRSRQPATPLAARAALAALDEVLLQEISNAQKVRIGGLVQLTVRVKPATKKRKGRNPATGEEIDIAAKAASVDLRARPLAKAKAALPSVQKARRRLAG